MRTVIRVIYYIGMYASVINNNRQTYKAKYMKS